MPFQTLGKVTLYFRESGVPRTPRVVFLNSLGTDCRIWDDLAEALNGRYHLLQYDQRGQGLSDAPQGPYSIGDHADDLLSLLSLIQWGPTVLCGLSIGGMIAIEACSRRPEQVRGLVLSDTSDVIGTRAFWEARMQAVREGGLEAIAEPVMKRWFGTSFFDEHPYDAEGWANLLNRAPVEGYLGSCAALRDGDLSDRLGRISVPTYCVCGSEDTSTTPAEVRSLSERIRGSAFVEVDEAGHLVPLERPHEFAFVLNEFMEERLES